MEQITLPTALSVTKRDASTRKSPSPSWVCDSEEDSRVFPTVSLHCTVGLGNQPLEEHDTRIPLFSGPVMRTRGAEPNPEERRHLVEASCFGGPECLREGSQLHCTEEQPGAEVN